MHQTDSQQQTCFIHVTGTQREKFIEFEFSIGDPELAVEMIMPVRAFEEFCARHQVQHLSADEVCELEYERMKWRFGQPGITE
ncbi:phenol hydroxylase [Acinetobacter sp. FL51]|jgi:phenol hydroxylase P0 protein|uniref:phenol hydroxylase subunit n=1 Tax=Acinetobacter sp. FL51 TaxID=2777978 RepID=UPI0018E17FED|nr:phenol hydroxylase subunit [Acinetobacter sp. FL51]MBI1453249.1 phenol hydroxylase [Acinetobacter sp. FL51]